MVQMKIKGSNIVTKNESELTKDLQVSHHGVNVEMITTKRGIAFYCGLNTKIVKNGSTLVAIPIDSDEYEFEKVVIQNGVHE